MVNIKGGGTVTIAPTGLEVKVADDKKIEHEGRLYTMSAFVGTFLPDELRTPSDQYQGPKYFTYKGETLSDLRNRLEEEH